MPSPLPSWTGLVWQEFRAGNLTRTARDVLLTLRTYRGRGGLICPSHTTLADRAKCHPATVWRALQAARELGLVRWSERRVRASWRSLRTSNRYVLLQPEAPVIACPRTTMQKTGGGERKENQEAREGRRTTGLVAMLAAAERLPDLLKARRASWAAGMVRVR